MPNGNLIRATHQRGEPKSGGREADGGGYLPETLLAVNKPANTAYAPHPLSYYSKFEITTVGPYYTETIPAESGVHVINGKSIEIVDRGTYVYFKGYTSNLEMLRIVGYR